MSEQSDAIDHVLIAAAGGTRAVKRIDTHAATVFLGPSTALKIKKPVTFPFLDFSTRDKRRVAITREFAINQPNAPQIYRGVKVVTRSPDGSLLLVASDAIPPGAEPVEWVLDMVRFDEAATLDRLAEAPIPPRLIDALADAVVSAEHRAIVRDPSPWIADLFDYIRQNDEALRAMPDLVPARVVAELTQAACQRFAVIEPLLRTRGAAGLVRLTHGDLHTGNIAVIDGKPVLFDAIEFDDAIATGDILYDAAFLIMDLDERGRLAEANRFLNRWLLTTARQADPGDRFADALDLQARGLLALPFFLMMRAAIRAKVTASKAAYRAGPAAEAIRAEAQRYIDLAVRDLQPVGPISIAIGGLSGTGKSTLARSLSPLVGHRPGAIHLRSDQIRKCLAGVDDLDHLPASSYTPEASARVYAVIASAADAMLRAGWSVVVDTVAARRSERDAFAERAQNAGARFVGLWLDAPIDVLTARVMARTGDASDADAGVILQQAAYDTGDIDWIRIDAGWTAEETAEQARAAIRSMIDDTRYS